MEKISEKQARLIAAYAVNVIQNHLANISAASYPYPTQAYDPHYDYWSRHFNNIRQMINGKSPQEIKEELTKKYALEDYQRKALHVSEFSDEDLDAISKAQAPEQNNHLNDELLEDE